MTILPTKKSAGAGRARRSAVLPGWPFYFLASTRDPLMNLWMMLDT